MSIDEQRIFKKEVIKLVSLIPEGRMTTYGAIAKALGYPKHARYVGKILNQSGDESPSIPAHRVVSSSGKLSGARAFGQLLSMEQRLEAEGVEVRKGKIVDFKRIIWYPIKRM